MNDFPQQEQPTSDTFDFSDNEALQPPPQSQSQYQSQYQSQPQPQPQPPFNPQPSQHGDGLSTVGSSDMSRFANFDRNAYSDQEIGLVYEIVVRAETILAEELTPSTGLPIHALFLAYEDVVAEHGLDPSETHISRLVFLVGGIKGQKSIMDQFKTAMARMNIMLAIEEPLASEDEHDNHDDHSVASEREDFHATDDEHTSTSHRGELGSGDESEDDQFGYENVPGLSTEPLDLAKEKYLADTSVAFHKQRHSRFLAVATLRRWYNTARYVNHLREETDRVHGMELREALEERFHTWRALSAQVLQASPDKVPRNAYSKRTERITIRAHEILLTKKALIRWRQSAQFRYRKRRDARLQAERLAKQKEYEDDDFKENPALARLAQRAHKNLVLSQAFAKWSNRIDEEGAKAEAASEAYEMSLKAKALGFARNRSTMDNMRKMLANKLNRATGSVPAQTAASDANQPEPVSPGVVKTAATAPVSSKNRPPLERPLSSMDIASRLQTRNPAEKRPTPSVVRPSTVIPIRSAPPTTAPMNDAVVEIPTTSASPTEPVPAGEPIADAEESEEDELDEQTMLARRHILRMRYFGAWERYTSESIGKVEQFGQERQDQRVIDSVSKWRNEAVSRHQQTVERNVEFQQTQRRQRVAQTIPKWREKTNQEEYRRGKVLEHYAERAEYYQRTVRSLPILREQTAQAEQREMLLRTYAERTNYYMRTAQALSIWRERAHEVSQTRLTLENYGERADYYYRTQNTLSTWQRRAKQRRKERLREAHLETRRMVKRSMGERCVRQWRGKLEPSYQRFEVMNETLANAHDNREWRQTSEAFNTWRYRTQERNEAAEAGDAVLKQKAMEQWREKAALHRDLEANSGNHWEVRTKSRALKNWNLGSLQGANRPEMVANALEKKERRLVRQGFETWYGRTADRLVPVELPNGAYRNVGQVVAGAQRETTRHQARGLLQRWQAAAADGRTSEAQDEVYAPTPGRPRLFLGSYGGRETTTPLAPVPNQSRWQARDSTMGRSEFGARTGRSERKNPKNLRVSWAA